MPQIVFPLQPYADGYAELRQAVEMIEQVAERYDTRFCTKPEAYGLDLCDWAWVGRLDAAAMILRSCLAREA